MPLRQNTTVEYRNRPGAGVIELTALGGLCAFVVLVLLEHLLEPSLDPLRHQVSEYVHSPTGALMTIGFVAWGTSLLATGLLVEQRWNNRLLAALFMVAAGGLLLVVLFPTETSAGELPPGVELTTTGKLHNLGSGLTSLALFISALTVGLKRGSSKSLRSATTGLVLASLVFSAGLLLIGPSVGGLRQRLLLLIACGWQLLLLHALGGLRRP